MQNNEQAPKMRILVIEDQEKHRQDAERFFAAHPEVEIKYRHDFNRAICALGFPQRSGGIRQFAFRDPKIDGVISDIYFPPDKRIPEISEALGVVVALICREKGIPCVLNTEGWHHGPKYQWIAHLSKDGFFPISYSLTQTEEKRGIKNWEEAFGMLCELVKAKSAENSATESP